MKRLALAALLLCAAGAAWPKTGRTYYTAEQVASALEKIRTEAWAKSAIVSAEDAAKRWVAMSDQELWDFVPPPDQLRALNVSFGVDCPVHGAEIFRRGGHYPWILSADKPFKVKCPVGGEEYPGNDFQPWNTHSLTDKPESGPGYQDLGAGWTDAKGRRYFFVGYWIFWQRWQAEVLPAVNQLAQAYLLSGKPVYAHKCAVLMSRIAVDYERFDYPTQAYHNGSWPANIGGRILDYIWTTGYSTSFARAYDAIYPALAPDAELKGFLQAKGCEEPQRHLEQKLLFVMAKDIMRGFIHGNAGMHQESLATLALVLDNQDEKLGPTTKQMVDWVMTGAGDSEYLLWNGFYRDGHGGESSPGYSSGWNAHYYNIARLLPRLGVDIFSNPKLKKMADIGLDLWIADKNGPSIGDTGSIKGAGRIGWSPVIQGTAFMQYGDPRFAQALKIMGAKAEGLFDTTFDEAKMEAVVAREGTDLGLTSRNLGGYGLAILESGEANSRRGLAMYYGHAGGGHGHRDRLSLELIDQRFPQPVLSDMGYPAHWLDKCTYWTTNTVSHYAVVVNESGHRTYSAGQMDLFASAPGLQLAEASADEVAYPGAASLYRRTVALVDISPTDYYLLDVYRVKGGWQHDYSFHGPAFPEFTVTGGTPGPVQSQGTLAGEDVAFGARPPSRSSGGVALNLRAGRELVKDDRPYDVRSLEGWTAYSGADVLTRKKDSVLTIPSDQPFGPGQVKVFLRVYDYNAGVNVVDVRLGDQTLPFRWEPGGEVGARWITQVFDLPAAVKEITLTAREHGQSYVLVQGLAVGTDAAAAEPRIWDPADSGYQYLQNIRRMQPAGGWSATWRDPASNRALTMTMPAGSAREVVLADAEPELQPGAPPSLQYLLARNQVSQGDDLKSTYVNVITPYQGTNPVGAVTRLTSKDADESAVGVQVVHGATRDLLHSSLAPGAKATWQGGSQPLTVAGAFAQVALDEQGVSRATLVDGTELTCGNFSLKALPSPTGKIVSVDHKANTITVDAPVGAAGVGRVAILGNELHRTSYTVRQVKPQGQQTVLGFGDVLFLVGMAKATGFDQKAAAVLTDTQLDGYGRVDGGRHQGRWLYNEDRSRASRIVRYGGGRFVLEGVQGELDQVYTDVDQDGRRQLWISDLGPGDTFRVPSITHVTRVRPNLYNLQAMTEVTLSLPYSTP